jgi:cysteine desulfurase/selenocysteine lyase
MGEKYVNKGDEILISEMEHHSNIVPWQMLCERKGAILKVIPFDNTGELMLDKVDSLLSDKTRIVALTHVLYGKEALLEELPPYQGGGDMVDQVTFSGTTYNTLPFKFEAGTTNYMGAIGLATAIDYLKSVGIPEIGQYENELIAYTLQKLKGIAGLNLYGNAVERISVFSFLLENIHPYDAGMILDKMGIAVRTGTHCTQPVMDHFGISGTIRASLVFYNTTEEVDRLTEGIGKSIQMLS